MLRLTIALCLILAAPAAAKPGDLDRTFATRGSTVFAGGPGYMSASDVALRADGSLLVAGNGQQKLGENWVEASTLARMTRSGRLQGRTVLIAPPHGPYYTNPATQRLALLPDGGVVIAATLDWQSHPHIAVFRVRADGTPDTSFGADGVASAGEELYVAEMGVDGAGRIVLAATRSHGDAAVVLRLEPNGALDTGYGFVSLTGSAGALLVRRDGSAVVATTHRGRARHRASVSVHTLDPAGRRVLSSRLGLHDTSGYQAAATALAPGPQGKLLVAGFDARRHVYGWVARLDAFGAVDQRFGRRTIASKTHDVEIRDMARDHRGRIVLAGARSHFDLPRTLVARLTPSGRRDRRFGPDGTVVLRIGSRPKTRLIASDADALAIDARNRIVLAGTAYDDDAGIREDLGRSYFAVARLKG